MAQKMISMLLMKSSCRLPERIPFILAGRTESDLRDMGDRVTSVLNSSRGKIPSAMINYFLRYARLLKKKRGKMGKAN